MFGFPILLSVIQIALLTLVFPYDTPKKMKQNKQFAQLNELMSKIYDPSQIQHRIDSIVTEEGGNQGPSYKETFFDKRYQMATIVGCALSAF